MANIQLFAKMLEAMIGTEEQDELLYVRGYRAFSDSRFVSEWPTDIEKNGWEAARRDMLAVMKRVATGR